MDAQRKPKVKLSGTDGNVFALLGLCRKALKKAGQESKATEMSERVFKAESYSQAISIMSDYVSIS